MGKTEILRTAKSVALTVAWTAVLWMVFCEGTEQTGLGELLAVKAAGLTGAWLLMRRAKIF